MSTETSSSGKLGYADYIRIPDDGQRHEIIEGVHVVNPAPSTYHQAVSKRLFLQLYARIEARGLGTLFYSPIDVQLSEHNIVQPDLVVVVQAQRTIITPTKIKGVPSLIVEILSPSTEESDRLHKKSLYARHGVPEYWIVDPFEHVVEQLVLRDSQYEVESHSDKISPTIIAEGFIDLLEVW